MSAPVNTIPGKSPQQPTPPATPAADGPPTIADTLAHRKVKGVMIRAPFNVGNTQVRSVRVGMDSVAEVKFDYAMRVVWVRVETVLEHIWGWTPFENVLGVSYEATAKGAKA